MVYNKIKELTKKIEMESKKLDKKIKDIEKVKLSITKDLKKNVKELKNTQLKKLQEERKNITNKVKEMKTDLINAKKEMNKKVINKEIDTKLKEISTTKKHIDKTAKKIMIMMSSYNKIANDKLISILNEVKEEDLKKDTGAFFKSIHNIFVHIIECDIYLFRIFRKYSNKKNIVNEEILSYLNNNFELNKEIKNNFKELINIRKKLDDIIIAIISSIDNFNPTLKIETKKSNIEIKKSRYQSIMHILNHSTHHRGEISALLDQMGYKNDYSNLMNI